MVFQSSFPIDLLWYQPQLASFMEALGGLARVIVFDQLNQGASDRFADPLAANDLETNSDDALAVLDAAHADRVTFFDMSFGVNAVMFAATYPQRVRSLILNNLRSSFPEVRNASYAQRRRLARYWLGIESLELENPRQAHDPNLRHWWGRARRLLADREAALQQI
jgi:pimeloyl-ACP methyl ester carboxylesterase